MEEYERLTARMAIQLAVPNTWVASIYPALFGVLFAGIKGYGLSITSGGLLVAACILMQAAVNTLNNYADYVKGTDTMEDNLEKNDAVLLYNHINPAHALILGVVYLAAGAALGTACCIKTGPMPLYIGAAGAAVVLLYSGGPLPLSYLPAGELVSGLVMGGLIPLGIAAAADNGLHLEVLLYSLPLIIGIALIMMSNNGCDIEKDSIAGRHTLSVLIGRKKTAAIYKKLIALWLAVLCILPVVWFGYSGIICPLMLIFFGKRFFSVPIRSDLSGKDRIDLMKSIVTANVFANGAYIIAAAVKFGITGGAMR